MLFVPPASSQLMIHIDSELRLFVCLKLALRPQRCRLTNQSRADAAQPGERLPSLPGAEIARARESRPNHYLI